MKAILIGNEELELNDLENQLQGFQDLEIVGKYIDPMQEIEGIENLEIDMAFLDIQSLGTEDLELAGNLLEQKSNLKVIYLVEDQEAAKFFEKNSLDYIVKPIKEGNIQKLAENLELKEPVTEEEILNLKLFGQVALLNAQGESLPLNWKTAKAEELFLYLVQHKGQIAHKSVLTEILWPEMGAQKAAEQLYISIYHLRRAISNYTSQFQIVSMGPGYLLTMENVKADIEEFEQFINENQEINDENIEEYQAILQLVTGEYLADHDYLWVAGLRQLFKLKWLETAFKITERYIEAEKLEDAKNICQGICLLEPMEERAHFLLMKIADLEGKPEEVMEHYDRLAKNLFEEMGLAPNRYLQKWYSNWLSKREGS